MPIRVVMSGATGWVGKALIPAIAAESDMVLAGAVARSSAGQDAGAAVGTSPLGVLVSATLDEALRSPSDVVVDYTKPDAVKAHALTAVSSGRNVVIGTSGLGAGDYAEIDAAARSNGVGVIAAGNFSITATLMKRFALIAAKYVPDVEVIDYASARKPDAPSGTARELAEALAEIRGASTAKPAIGGLGHSGHARRSSWERARRAGACSEATILYSLMRGAVRPSGREADDPPRRRVVGRALCGRHIACDPPGGRHQRIGPRTGRADRVTQADLRRRGLGRFQRSRQTAPPLLRRDA